MYDEGEEEEILNEKWASISHMKVKQINQLEREFLDAIEWNVFVNLNLFYHKMINVTLLVIRNECRKRSWSGVTYNEMMVLLEYDEFFSRICLLVYNYCVKFLFCYLLLVSLIYSQNFGVHVNH